MKNVFGLDIGASFIKVVQLERADGNSFFLDSAFSYPAPIKGMLSESPLDQEEMAKTIIQILENAKIKSKKVNLCLPENQVFTKIIEMPNLSDRELASAIYYEAEQYIPIPITEVTLDYKVISKGTGDEPKMTVFLVGAPNRLIEKYEYIMSLANLEIANLETETLAVYRSLVAEDNFPPTIMINIGLVSTTLSIVKDSLLVFVYSIPVGGAVLTRAIASDFGFSSTQAEEYKKTYGIEAENFSGKIGQATLPILSVIISEIKKALEFYKNKYSDNDPIKQIILSGGSAKLSGLDNYFTLAVGIETVIADPWKIIKNNEQLPAEIKEEGVSFTVAVGLAMKDYE